MTEDPGERLGRGEPLVGRGHARAGAGRVPESDAGSEARAARGIPRPALDAGRGSPWAAPRRVRLVLGLALVAALAVAWIGLGPRGTTAAVDDPAAASRSTTLRSTAPSSIAEPSTTTARTFAVPRWVPRPIAATCTARRAGAPVTVVVDCRPGRGVTHLRYTRYASRDALEQAYEHDARGPRGGTGPPKCARGLNDERAWSIARRPTITAGRYRCTDARTARIVWTDERTRVLATAARADADLRSLYVWWTTVPGPSPGSAAR